MALHKKLQERINALQLTNPMSIEQLLNPAENVVHTTQVPTDEELLEQAKKPEEQGPDELEAEKGSELSIPLPD